MAQKGSCGLLWNKVVNYWFPSVDDDYKGYETPREPPCYRWTRFISLILVYFCIGYFIYIFIKSFLSPPFLVISKSHENIEVPTIFMVFDTTVYSNIIINCSYILNSLNGTTSCDNKIFTIVDPPNTYYVFTDPGTNFTDGTNPDLPTGFNFRFSANNSITNDSSLITASYPTIVFIDTDSITSSNNDNSQLSDALVELGNFYLLSPNQRQIMWLERVRHKDFDSRTKRGVLSVASKAKKSMVNYYGLTTKIQTLNMYSPSTVTSQFISTLEIRNQSNIVTTYAESDKASQTKLLTFFTSLGGANAFFMALYMFLYGKKSPGLLPYLIYPFLCCSGPANFVRKRLLNVGSKNSEDLEKRLVG